MRNVAKMVIAVTNVRQCYCDFSVCSEYILAQINQDGSVSTLQRTLGFFASHRMNINIIVL